MVDTTIEYVWKETSRFKKARTGTGIVMSKTTELSKKRAETSIFVRQTDQISHGGIQDSPESKSRDPMIPVESIYINGKSDRLLNLPKMESSDLKALYKEFNAGKKPADVIADYGFNPDLVEFEYHRFLRLSGIDIDGLLKQIISDCSRIMEPQGRLKLLIDKYHEEHKLQNKDICKLLSLKNEHEWQSRLHVSMHIPIVPFPDSIVPLKCIQCRQPLLGALINPNFDIGVIILNQFSNFLCNRCRDSRIQVPSGA